MAQINRQIMGLRSRAEGEMFENMIVSACDYYWMNKVACIEKTPEPMRVLKPYGNRKSGQFIACFTKQAQPDFKGVLCDGNCVVFDAKHTEKDRIQKNAVTDHQSETFDKYEEMGAKCYVIVSIGFERFFRVPWNVWKRMKDLYGHKYMSVDELASFEVKQKRGIVLFLEGVELKDDNTKE